MDEKNETVLRGGPPKMPSVMQRVGTPNAQHNLDKQYRKQLDHVDPSLSQHNEIIRQRSLEDLYEEHLQPAFDEFNEQQKRKDRRLDVKYNCTTYLEYQRALDEQARASKNTIDQKGRPPIREIVWQFGNPEQGFGCKDQTPESREFAKELLMEVQAEAERRYTQLVWGDVVFHADEVSVDAEGVAHGSFHLHADFIPLCHNNKRGPAVQVAFERCLEEMGFKTFEAWKHDLDSIMEGVLQRHGLERTFMDNHNEHQNYTEFHRQQRKKALTKEFEMECDATRNKADQLRGEADKLKVEMEVLTAEKSTLEAVVGPLRKVKADVAACNIQTLPVPLRRDKVMVDLAGLEALREQAQAHVASHEKYAEMEQQLRNEHEAKMAILDRREKGIAEKESLLAGREARTRADWSNLEREQKKFRAEKAEYKMARDELNKKIQEVNDFADKVRLVDAANENLYGDLREAQKKAEDLARKNEDLERRISDMVSEHAKTEQKLTTELKGLKDQVKDAYDTMSQITRATNSLIHNDQIKIKNITKKQKSLIQGVQNCAAEAAEKAGFPDVAKSIRTRYGIVGKVKEFVEERLKELLEKDRCDE